MVFIIIISCRLYGYPWPSLATSPYRFIASGRSSGLHPVSSHSCCMYVRAGRPAFAWPYVGVHRRKSLMSSSLLLQQCPACLVRLTWIAFVMGGRYSWCLVGCCCHDIGRLKEKAYDISPQTSTIEYLKLYEISNQVIKFIKEAMKKIGNWNRQREAKPEQMWKSKEAFSWKTNSCYCYFFFL